MPGFSMVIIEVCFPLEGTVSGLAEAASIRTRGRTAGEISIGNSFGLGFQKSAECASYLWH
jgi:hypothetical protein